MDLPCYICCYVYSWSYFIFEQMKHILFDLEGCSEDLLDDARHVRNSLFHASIASNSEILKIDFHKFYPQGVTGYALLADSHLSIHTWPEKGVAKCDIFTCGVPDIGRWQSRGSTVKECNNRDSLAFKWGGIIWLSPINNHTAPNVTS